VVTLKRKEYTKFAPLKSAVSLELPIDKVLLPHYAVGMLSQIRIKNFALIEDLTLEFHPRLNIFTGETGAGKTILIDALSAVLGERLDLVSLRLKEERCVIEVVFDLRKSPLRKKEEFEAWLAEDDESLILRREVDSEGRNKCSINGKSANVSNLREIGKYLADFHGQHDHQLLLDPASHIFILDRLAGIEKPMEQYSSVYVEYAAKKRELEELRNLESGRERELDLLKFQISEVSKVNPQPGEDLKLREEHIRLANAEKLYEKAAHLINRLSEGEGSVIEEIGASSKYISELAAIDPSLKPLTEQVDSIEAGLDDLARSIRDYQDSITFDADRLKEVEERIEAIGVVKRKYGGSLDVAISFLAEARKRLTLLENSEVMGRELEKAVAESQAKVESAAKKLSSERKEAARKLKSLIEKELKDLGIAQAKFECRVEKSEPNETGADKIEFFISPNVGEELLPLARIISGGEASRVMLALKRALIDTDEIPTMIFDEIDANIGGRLGSVVGEKLAEIAKKHQVLLVTHLPQIASFANRHIKVSKSVEERRTKTHYAAIEGEARVRELAEMMAGEKKSEVATKHARELLAQTK